MDKKVTRIILAVAVVTIFILGFATTAFSASVTPVTLTQDGFDGPGWGDEQLENYMKSLDNNVKYFYKIDGWDEESKNGTYTTDEGNTITILNSDGYTFDWESDWPVYVVIVKGGPDAYAYYYPEGSYGDTGLTAPDNKEISFVAFGYGDPPVDYGWFGETAWADGDRYVRRGNWATYTEYAPDKEVTLYAGQHLDAGTVTFNPTSVGYITITINLNDGWRFALDSETALPQEENVKIMGYDEKPKAANPSPGQFLYKYTVDAVEGGEWTSPEIPEYNYYGVHSDVEEKREIEVEE